MLTSSIKLIFRSWSRNKTFAVISLLSLAIGIACTNMLAAFVIHEYNVEATNPNKERILYMSQDSPMKSGEKISYVAENIAPAIKDMFPEVDNYLRLKQGSDTEVMVGETRFPPIVLLEAEQSLPVFFPYQVLYGNLEEALTEPNKIALTKQTALRFFGEENAIGKTLSFQPESNGMFGSTSSEKVNYQVCAVLKENEQSFLHFDALTRLPSNYWGGVSLLLMNQSVDTEKFSELLKENNIQTLQGDIGRYYFNTLQESYFQRNTAESHLYINNQQKLLLYVGALSALLILLIACFNYINLNFSRLLQQIRMIHTQKLMGASRRNISNQLFLDTALTVLTSFCLSILFMHWLLPYFNEVMSGRLNTTFFFNRQVLPVLCGFILILSVIPAWFISRKVNDLSLQDYRIFFTGKKRKAIIATLSITQFAISIALIMAMFGIHNQVNLIRQGGEGYQNLIEIGDWQPDNSYLKPFVAELRNQPDFENITVTQTSFLHSPIRQTIIRDEKGGEAYYSQLLFSGNTNFFSTFRIEILQGLTPEEAITHYARPVYINEKFAEILVREGENPIGSPINKYDSDRKTQEKSEELAQPIIAGIVRNFYTNSLEEEIPLASIDIQPSEEAYNFVYLRLDPEKPQQLTTIQRIYEKSNPGRPFTFNNVYQDFITRNNKIFSLSRLILMYALISLFLTCFGLFGTSLYATEQRTKEVGIRKVNGATSWQIIKLLNRQFIGWIAIAFVIAVPGTWYWLDKWLESYVYRAPLHAGICISAGLVVLVISLLTVSWLSYKTASGNPIAALRDE